MCQPTTNASRRKPVNPLRLDPTRTTTLRRQVMAEMRKRFRKLRGAINRLIIGEDAFGITADKQAGVGLGKKLGLDAILATTNATSPAQVVVNTRWRFVDDAAKIDNFKTWLKEQVEAGILEVSPGNIKTPWLEPYIESAYKRGAVRAYTDANAARIAAAGVADFGFIEGGKQAFLESSFNTPVAQSKIRQLSTRAFSQLQGVTAQMDQEMTRILSDALTAGHGTRKIAANLNKSITALEKKRALVIARTEIVHTHNEGQLDSFQAMNIDEVGVMAEWSTAHDDLVCPLCQPMEGVVLTIKEARGLIPRHPNCRCAWLPANVGETGTKTVHAGAGQGLAAPGTKPTGKTTRQVGSGKVSAKRIQESIKKEHPKLSIKEARKASRWAGADLKTVTGKPK